MGIKSQAGQWLTFLSRNWEPMAHSEGHPQLCGVRIPPIPPRVHLPVALSPAHFPIGDTQWDAGDGSALRSGAAWRRLWNDCQPQQDPCVPGQGQEGGEGWTLCHIKLHPGPQQGHFSSWFADKVGTLQHKPSEPGHREWITKPLLLSWGSFGRITKGFYWGWQSPSRIFFRQTPDISHGTF